MFDNLTFLGWLAVLDVPGMSARKVLQRDRGRLLLRDHPMRDDRLRRG